MRIAMLAAALATAAAVHAQPANERPQDRWNLADLYPTRRRVERATWRRWRRSCRRSPPARASSASPPQRLKACLDLQYDVLRALPAPAGLRQRAGQRGHRQRRRASRCSQKTRVLGSQLTEATSFVNPEILAIGARRIDAFFRAGAGPRHLPPPLDDILRAAPHTLDAAGEAIVARFALVARRSRLGLQHLLQRRHAVAHGEALRRQGGEARPVGLRASTASPPTATTARRSWTRSSASGRSSSARSA